MHNDVNPSDPNTIPKFVDKLQKPKIARPRYNSSFPNADYHELQMKEAKHRFHKDFPQSNIWGYDGLCPGPTIEATKDKTTCVKYNNRLPIKHFLPVDYTLHSVSDSQEVRTVVHLHGANVDWESDGNPESWYSKDFIHTGPKFKREVHEYTNHQPGTTMWYHDHTMGLTRLNVYAGLAGFYLLRDTSEDRLQLPCGNYEIPLMIQDRSFNEDGSIFYPDAPPFPVPVHPSITPGFVGNTITVNGKVWPYFSVEPRKYRFRLLNASNRRGYVLSLSNEQPLIQIGTDGGFLTAPLAINSVELLPAERTDIIIDFSNLECQEITLVNTDTEFPGEHTSVVLQFKVDLPLKDEDTSKIPERLAESMDLHAHHAHIKRDLPLSVSSDSFGRPMLLLNDRMFHEPITEKPSLDSIEIWNIINATPFPHPIHVHLVQFQILERRPFNVELYQKEGKLEFTGDPQPPRDYERGWKDTVKTDAGMVTKIIMHWKDHVGYYMWHCHFLEHEDHDMMRPILVIKDVHPVQQPHADEGHTSDSSKGTTTLPINPQDTTIPTNNHKKPVVPHDSHATTKQSKYLQYQSANQNKPPSKKRKK
ncbi:multicopper oxidase family protein [Lysinibacillus contaminans]|uniref:multicopper oxidase family protein n=1 Tax=Lysinibacillus contaminans TaxID=1293441 RepID=UPI000A7FB147|nr:multicopper oxidase [Lysinibacillus contaminans]